jgi:hypothetical protein
MFMPPICRFLLLFGLSLAALLPAQAQPAFSSAYTDLSKDCKELIKGQAAQEGQDAPLVCRGYGGYQLRIDFSAANNHLNVQPVSATLKHPQLLWQTDITIPHFEKGMVEWRMADGKPFAIIVRSVDRLETPTDKTPHPLVVKGLKNHPTLQTTISPQARSNDNAQARSYADSAYLKK